MSGPIERQTIWDNAAQMVSDEGGFAEYDRGISELVADLFGYAHAEASTVLEALRLRRDQQREVWRLNLAVDPTTGSPR